jgi:hypothetical protein
VNNRTNKPGEVRHLIAQLSDTDPVRREAAIARLAIIGRRAVDRLLAAWAGADRDTRISILRALEFIGDARALPVAAAALGDGGDVAVSGVAVLRALNESPHDAAPAALDALVGAALDRGAERHVRLAALNALPEDVRQRAGAALDLPRRPAPAADGGTADALWRDAMEGRLPDAPAALREVVAAQAAAAPLSNLRRLVEAVRARETETSSRARRAEWRAVRGALHQALALRRSRVALDDLRESIAAAAEPLPASFLSAIHAVGDASALEALAAAHARAPVSEPAWREQIASAFRAIARRERVTRRHAVHKRVTAKWPDAPFA